MNIESNLTISKFVESGVNTQSLSGYLYVNGNSVPTSIRVYPYMDTKKYYELEESSVVEIIEHPKNSEKKTVFVRDDAELLLVTKHLASELGIDGENTEFTPTRSKLPPWLDRLSLLSYLSNKLLLEMYLGVEQSPGTGQTGKPGDDL